MKTKDIFPLFLLFFLVAVFFSYFSCAIDNLDKKNKQKTDNSSYQQVLNLMTVLDREKCRIDKERNDERYIIRQNGKSGFVDGCGNIVVEPQYDSVLEFSQGFSRVEMGGKYEYINKNGAVVLTAGSAGGGFFREGFFRTKYIGDWGERWIYGTKKDLFVFRSDYIKAYSFFGGYALLHDGRNIRIVTTNKTSVAVLSEENNIGFLYPNPYLTYRERSIFHRSEHSYYTDYIGQKIYDSDFVDRIPFCQGKGFSFDNKKRVIRLFDNKNNTICKCILSSEETAKTPVCDSYSSQKNIRKFSYSSQDVRESLSISIDVPNYLPVHTESGLWGLFDLHCNRIFSTEYEQIIAVPSNRFIARKKGKWQLFDKNGKTLLPGEYHMLEVCSSGDIILQKSRRSPAVMYDRDGKEVFRVEYGSISCPLKEKIIVRESNREYLYDLVEHKQLRSFRLQKKTHEAQSKHFNFIDGKISVWDNKWTTVFDADFKNILLRVKNGRIRVDNTFNGKIRILTIDNNIYYLTRQYKVFWSDTKEATK